MLTHFGVPDDDLMNALIDLVANARLPQDPDLREAVMGVALAAFDAIERAFSEEADWDGDGNQEECERN